MATPVIQQVVVVPAQREQVMSQLLSVSGADSYAPAAQSADALTLHRRRIPVWAIVLAIVFFPIGLLFLLVKNTEVVDISLGRAQGGTQVTITGQASGPLMSALQYALGGYQATPAGLPQPTGPATAGTAPMGAPPRSEGAGGSSESAPGESAPTGPPPPGPPIPPPYGPPGGAPPSPGPPSPGSIPGGMPATPPPPPATFGPPGGEVWRPPAPPGSDPDDPD
ncbi:MAG: hypothetical protein JOZ25_10835 [Actinobacteria bacterium]|nr:hypothetical protein [Actinomycetota bacterium]